VEVFEFPAFIAVARKRMDDREVLNRCGWNSNVRNPFGGRRKRWEKREREMPDSVAEFSAVRSVPGIDGVERFQLRDAGPFHHSDQIQASIGKSPGAVGKTYQGEQWARGPDFGVRRARCFEGGKRKNDVADRSRPNQETFVNG
jgi:hypothetical protein